MGYLCLSCYEEYDKDALNLDVMGEYGEYLCPKKTCGGFGVVEIDDLLLPIIKLLNIKGYKTDYCCSGHSYDVGGLSNTYISFKDYCVPKIIPKDFTLEDEEYYKKQGWNYSSNEVMEHVAIRKYYSESLTEYKLYIEILKTMIDLTKWVEKLEYFEE